MRMRILKVHVNVQDTFYKSTVCDSITGDFELRQINVRGSHLKRSTDFERIEVSHNCNVVMNSEMIRI